MRERHPAIGRRPARGADLDLERRHRAAYARGRPRQGHGRAGHRRRKRVRRRRHGARRGAVARHRGRRFVQPLRVVLPPAAGRQSRRHRLAHRAAREVEDARIVEAGVGIGHQRAHRASAVALRVGHRRRRSATIAGRVVGAEVVTEFVRERPLPGGQAHLLGHAVGGHRRGAQPRHPTNGGAGAAGDEGDEIGAAGRAGRFHGIADDAARADGVEVGQNRIERRRRFGVRPFDDAHLAYHCIHAAALERRVGYGQRVGDGRRHLRGASCLHARRRGVGDQHVDDGRVRGQHRIASGETRGPGRRHARWQFPHAGQGRALAHDDGAVGRGGQVVGHAAGHHAAHEGAPVPRERGGARGVAGDRAHPRRVAAPVALEPFTIDREHHVVEEVQQERRARRRRRHQRRGKQIRAQGHPARPDHAGLLRDARVLRTRGLHEEGRHDLAMHAISRGEHEREHQARDRQARDRATAP